MAVSVLSGAIGRAGKARNMGLVFWDARRRFNSYLFRCAVGFGGLCWRLDYHCVTARYRSRQGGNNVERLGTSLCRQPGLEPAACRVRATDENLPRASAAWRPTASATGQYGYNYFDLIAPVSAGAAALGPRISGVTRLRQATDPGRPGRTFPQWVDRRSGLGADL
jgi:hypothetical protein